MVKDKTLQGLGRVIKYKPKHRPVEVTTDIVIFTIEDNELKVLLVKRKYPPFKGGWALPGGFVRPKENLEYGALRELREETGVHGIYLEQLYTFGDPKRDPRGRVITIGYFALVPSKKLQIKASDDAADAKLISVASLPNLAFDHEKILVYALGRLRSKIQYTNIVWSLLPKEFPLSQILNVYEAIWNKKMDKRNFIKKLLSLGLLTLLKKQKRGGRQRPAKLYKFKTTKYTELKRFF